jgi:thioredoxin reductase (NADPH)
MFTADQLLAIGLFAKVPLHERQSIAERAADIDLAPGDWLISEGEVPAFFGLLSGKLDLIKGIGTESRRISWFEPGDTFGEVPLLLDSPAIASVRAVEHSRVFRLDPADFRALILSCKVLNAEIIATMSRRVSGLQEAALAMPKVNLSIVGPRWDLACHDVRDFLFRNHVPFIWLDPSDADASENIPADLLDASLYPVILLPNNRRLVAPSTRALADAVNLRTRPAGDHYDLAIVGAGPAGLAAAVYGASEGLRTVIFEREAPGGQAGTSSRIENYLGFPTGVSGDDLGLRALRQAERFGADVIVAREISRIVPGAAGQEHAVVLDDDSVVHARAIVLSTGVAWRRLDAPGINELSGRGVYIGAARTEALGTRGKRVHLIGGGNSAGQAAMFFSNYAAAVTILVRGPGLAASMSQYLIDELGRKANVAIEPHSEVAHAHGSDHLSAIEIRDARDGTLRMVDSDGLFIFIGADAQTAWLPESIVRDKAGYVCTGRDVVDILNERNIAHPWDDGRDPYLLETSIPGIFAAGDVRHGSVKRVASGVGEGSMSVAFVHQYLQSFSPQPA